MWRFPVLIIFLCASVLAKAQEAISVAYNYGTIVIHSPSIEPLVKGPVHGFTINYALSNRHGAEWRRFYNFPDYGISYNFKNYNNPEQLGNSHSITAFLQIPFLKKSNSFNFGFKGFAGLGIFTNKYDPYFNPENLAISSALNISAEARLYSKISIRNLFFEYSFGLNHFSNGLIKAPNLGLNVLNNAFVAGYYLEDKQNFEQFKRPEYEQTENFEFWGVSSFGFKEIDTDIKKYMFSGLSLNFSKYLSNINKAGIGIDFLNDPSLVPLAYKKYYYLGSSKFNFRYGISVHHEFIMGKTGLFAAYGFYLRNSEYYSSQRYYKVGFKYYHNNFIAQVLVRALPLFRADVVEFGIGYRWVKKNRSDKTELHSIAGPG